MQYINDAMYFSKDTNFEKSNVEQANGKQCAVSAK